MIGLAPWVIASRLKIDWGWTGWTSIGTLVLAVAPGILASVAAIGAYLQRQQLVPVEGQLRLARDEFQAAQVAAWPELHADVHFTNWQNAVVNAVVKYVHGSQPAYAVDVVIRRTDLLYDGEVGTLAPMQPRIDRTFGTLSDHMEWPAHIPQVGPTEQDFRSH